MKRRSDSNNPEEVWGYNVAVALSFARALGSRNSIIGAMNAKNLLFLVPLVLAAPSCGKVRDLVSKSESSAAASSGEVAEVSSAQYQDFINQPGKLVVVDFHADWCPPCKQLAPLLEKAAGEFQEVAVVGKVDVDKAKDVAATNGIRSIPDVRFFRDGKMVDRFVGLIPESEIHAKFAMHSKNVTNSTSANAPAAGEPAIQPMRKDWLPPGIEKR